MQDLLTGLFSDSQLKAWQATLPARLSCRQYKDEPPLEALSALNYLAQKLKVTGARIVVNRAHEDLIVRIPLFPPFVGVTHAAYVITDPDCPMASFYGGLLGQAFSLACEEQGLKTCWVAGNFRRSAVAGLLGPGEKAVAIITFGLPLDENAPSRKRKALKQLCTTDPADWPLWAYQAAEAVRLGPSSMNRQPWQMSFTGQTLALTVKPMNSLDGGIAAMQMLAGMGDLAFTARFDQQGKSLMLRHDDTQAAG